MTVNESLEGMIKIGTGSLKGRLAMAAIVVGALVFTWFGVRWQIGNMLGELTSPSQPNALELAQAAMGLAPNDPLGRSLFATKLKEEFSEESIAGSVENFEEVVRLSPNDYRWWIELGRAYEQADRLQEAEAAFKRSVELAPAYTFPQWQIGNFYLRRDRAEEAFAHLSRATEKSIVYREQVFALAWDYFDKDPVEVERLAADTPGTKVTLAQFYAARGAADDAIRVWGSIPEEERARHPQIIKNIVQHLYSKRFYRQALAFSKQAGLDTDAEFEKISNPSFEKFLGETENIFFAWRVGRSEKGLEIGTDSSARADGQRSLKLSFKNYAKPELYNVSQLVAVEPLGRYRLSFMLRVDSLRTGGEPLIEVVDANNDISLVRSQRFPLGSHDWQPWSIEFVVPEGSDGVTIRTTRDSCGENCPISGTIWYDAFKLERL